MEDAGPAEDVTAAGYLGGGGRKETDGTAGRLGAAGAQAHLLNQVPVHQQVRVRLVPPVFHRCCQRNEFSAA